MAHECISCGSECYCQDDIDDCLMSLTPDNCETCGCAEDQDGWRDEDDDDDDYDDGTPYLEHHCPHCGVEYDAIDYEFQLCHLCKRHA